MKRVIIVLCVALFAFWGCKVKSESNITNNGSGSSDSGSSGNGTGDNGSVPNPTPTPPPSDPAEAYERPSAMYLYLPGGFAFGWATTTQPIIDIEASCEGAWSTAEIINEKTGKTYRIERSQPESSDCSIEGIELAPGDNPLRGIIRTSEGSEKPAYSIKTVTYNKTVDFVDILKFPDNSDASEGEANTVTATVKINDDGNLYKNTLKLVRKDNSSYKDEAVFNDSGNDGDVTAGDGVYSSTFKTDSLKEGEYTYRATATVGGIANYSTAAHIRISVKDLLKRQLEHRAESNKIWAKYFGPEFDKMPLDERVAYLHQVAEKIKGTPGLKRVSVTDSGGMMIQFEHAGYVVLPHRSNGAVDGVVDPNTYRGILLDEQEDWQDEDIKPNNTNNDEALPRGSSKKINKSSSKDKNGEIVIGNNNVISLSAALHEFGSYDSFYTALPLFVKNSYPKFTRRFFLNSGANLEKFKSISDYGMVIIDSHGNYDEDLKMNLVMTGEKYTPELEVEYKDMIDREEIFWTRPFPDGRQNFLVSKNFFNNYLSPMPNSLVYVCACQSGFTPKGETNGLYAVFKEKGAKGFIGYKTSVTIAHTALINDILFTSLLDGDTVKAAIDKVKKKISNDNLIFEGEPTLQVADNGLKNGGFEELEEILGDDGFVKCSILKGWTFIGHDSLCMTFVSAVNKFNIPGYFSSSIIEGKQVVSMETDFGASFYQKFKLPSDAKTISLSYNYLGRYLFGFSGRQFCYKKDFRLTLTDSDRNVINILSHDFSDILSFNIGSEHDLSKQSGCFSGYCGDRSTFSSWRTLQVPVSSFASKEVELRFATTDSYTDVFQFDLCETGVLIDNITIQ